MVDGPETIVFRAAPNGMLMLIGNDPIEAFIKVAWYDALSLHLVLVVACALIFLSALLLWPLGFVRRVMRRGAALPQSGRKAQYISLKKQACYVTSRVEASFPPPLTVFGVK